ncbi:signal recognition particle protein Srp14 [Chloropicon primus]|uniref:Signal recognition particle 14 kDa protein n=1 Tax=Chloropicon primus TaxID=1764295 RepID=A0A5B8MUA0_9CHLO|nr:signal recognition particle protein Srp14 [Chloropicon primus]UPR03158.1 signal recognition particle protein Srp14 [Chloropicon primus]|mmetsp:Transcript_8790/g.25083  ORF Transcript_8790/g.25083 Transcript_8790/m.25083 type:complete len:114 (+) Transcript_8790:187-528(+)|eukprot:QDZ23947.1 signal recognition particle protein Srp14 [Chloropicon primus]
MAVLEVNRFLTELAGLYEKCKEGKAGKAVSLTMKRTDLKPKTRKQKKNKDEEKGESGKDSYCCLVRAKHGKKKISTIVSAKDHLYFLSACNTICKAHMDALKRRDRSKRKAKK